MGPVNAAVSRAHEVKAKVGDGTRSGLVETLWRCPRLGVLEVVGCGEAMAQLQDRVAVASVGCLRPVLGVCLGQFFVFSSEPSEGICSLAPSSQRPSLLHRERLSWRDYKAESGLFL